jgi:hypothetical protein
VNLYHTVDDAIPQGNGSLVSRVAPTAVCEFVYGRFAMFVAFAKLSLGNAAGVGDGEGVGVRNESYSYAPISQTKLKGRATPRWSVEGQPLLSPALIAALPRSNARVIVGPPLFWSGPRVAGVLVRSPVPVSGHDASLLRLWP